MNNLKLLFLTTLSFKDQIITKREDISIEIIYYDWYIYRNYYTDTCNVRTDSFFLCAVRIFVSCTHLDDRARPLT